MAFAQPALEYLVSLSGDSLDAFHFSRLARTANLQNEMSEVLKQWIEAILEAKLARWVHGRRNDRELKLRVKSLGRRALDARRGASTIAASCLFVLKTLNRSASAVTTLERYGSNLAPRLPSFPPILSSASRGLFIAIEAFSREVPSIPFFDVKSRLVLRHATVLFP